MSELDAPLKPAGSRVFSAPVLVLLVVMIIIGVVFGVMFKESQQSRSIYMAQTSDASALKEALKPKVAQFEKAAKVVGSLEGDQVAFEEAARLAKLDFTPDDNVFSGGRFLLGPTIMSEVTGYIADATILETMLEHHDRLTNKVDKEELERLIAENEILQNDNQFVVVFNFQHLLENARDDNYLPKPGRLATVERFELNEAGKVDFKLIGDSEVNESPVQGVIPLGKADILKSGGENALQRYRARVQEIKIQASKLEQASRSMLADIDKIAERGDPPLISL